MKQNNKRSLPNTGYTVHDILIPSIKQTRRFRPFLVKQNKALTIAQGSGDQKVMLETLRSVIASCYVDSRDFDFDKLATYDFEYLLIKLRSISVDSNVTLIGICQDQHDGRPEQSRKMKVLIDLNKVQIVGLDKYQTNIKLSDDLAVIMKAPTVSALKNLISNCNQSQAIDASIDKVAEHIDKICYKDEIFEAQEYNQQQLRQWIEMLTEEQMANLINYFYSIPYCRVRVDWTCPVCGKHNVRYIEGLSYFF